MRRLLAISALLIAGCASETTHRTGIDGTDYTFDVIVVRGEEQIHLEAVCFRAAINLSLPGQSGCTPGPTIHFKDYDEVRIVRVPEKDSAQ